MVKFGSFETDHIFTFLSLKKVGKCRTQLVCRLRRKGILDSEQIEL